MTTKLTTTFLLVLLSAFYSDVRAQAPYYQWSSGFISSNATGTVEAKAMTTDTLGNVYVAGYFSDTADFDPGSGTANMVAAGGNDIFVCKLNPNGAYVWAKRIGGTGNDYLTGIAVDHNGNVHLTGYFNGTTDFDPGVGTANLSAYPGNDDIFVCKLNNNGDFVWAKSIGGKQRDHANALAVDANSNVYMTGYFQDTVDFDPGAGMANLAAVSGCAFVWRLDSAGAFVWAKQMAGNGSAEGNSIALDAKGNIYTTGDFIGLTADFDPGTGVANLASYTGTYMAPGAFVSKLNASGNYVWAKAFYGSTVSVLGSSTGGFSIAVDKVGNVYTSGNFMKTIDFDPGTGTANLTSSNSVTYDAYLSKLDSNGAYVWARKFGNAGSFPTFGDAVAFDDSGDVYMTGNFGGAVDFDPGSGSVILTATTGSNVLSDVYVLKLNAAGNYVWARQVGGTYGEYSYGIAIDHAGGIYVAGSFKGTVDFDPGSAIANMFSTSQNGYVFKWQDSVAIMPGVAVGNTVQSRSITLAPQPASDNIVIHCSDATLFGREAAVYSIQGASVAHCRLDATTNIDVASWVPGIYYLRLPDGSGARILKQ